MAIIMMKNRELKQESTSPTSKIFKEGGSRKIVQMMDTNWPNCPTANILISKEFC
jgi:hypothetical protein